MAKVFFGQGPGACWTFVSGLNGNGYGSFMSEEKGFTAVRPHRWMYERCVGVIPAGLQIDHLCRNRACVNPVHLEAVTGLENIRRGNAKKTECLRGHLFDAENTRFTKEGHRVCRTCNRHRQREFQARKRAK